MKIVKKLSFLLVFVVLVGALLVPVSYMLRPADGPNEEIRNRMTGFYAEPEDSLDAVVVGSSAVYRYVNNPQLWQETGITSYNFATPGFSIFLLEDLIDEVNKTQSPEVIIVDARKFMLTENDNFKKNRFQQLVSNIKYSWNRCEMINKLIDDPIERMYYYLDIMIYHDNWETLTLDSIEYADNEREDVMKAWQNIDKIEVLDSVDVTGLTTEKSLSKEAEDTLISLLEKCKNEDINILFVSAPWQIDDNNQMQSLYMQKIVEEYGFNYLDMNIIIEELGLDFETDFYNKRHVNAYGAEKVTEYLGEYLENNYNFEYTHTDSVVEAWDQAAKLNQEEMDLLKAN